MRDGGGRVEFGRERIGHREVVQLRRLLALRVDDALEPEQARQAGDEHRVRPCRHDPPG